MTDQSRTSGSVSVAVRYMLVAVLSMPAVLAVNYVVSAVDVRLRDSVEEASHAGLGVALMPVCNGCKKAQEKRGLEPREIQRMPIEVTQHKTFKRKGLPLQLCDYCDGDAVQHTLETHRTRNA